MENQNTNVKVILRTRPTPSFATKNIGLDAMENSISLTIPKNEDKGLINNQKESWTFKFDKILHNVSQEEVFEYCGREIVRKSLEGYNGTVFTYGQTGSGKTFTMTGSQNNFNYRGVIPRAITRVFQEIGEKPDFEINVKISYLEIYNELLFDLLSPIPTHEQKADISIQEDPKGNLIFKGLTKHTVNNEEEAFNLLFEGETNRTISEHQLNKESTRSHCVFMIYMDMKSRIESTEKIITSKINFVDLAGSERVKKTGSTGITLKEANYINKSLTFLEQVVVSLTDKTKKSKTIDHVPYRQSKLTHILKDSIGGNCRTNMIANIWPEEAHLDETLSTLKFAKRMMNVINEASVNIQLDTNALLKKYVREIKELKQELAMHNTLANRGRVNYDPYTPEEQYQQQMIAKKFLNGTDDIEFDSVRQAKELFYQCRLLYKKLVGNNPELINENMKVEGKNSIFNNANLLKKNTYDDDGQGVLEIKPSFGLGQANKDARPVNKLEISKENINALSDKEDEEKTKKVIEDYKKKDDDKINIENIPDKNTAFQIYKTESLEAREIESGIFHNSEELSRRKNEAKVYMESCNNYKKQLDETKIKLNEKKLNKLNLGDDVMNIIDEEECKLIQDFKDYKEIYKENLDKFKNAKSEINTIKGNLDLLRIKYVENFEKWFSGKYGIRIEEYEYLSKKTKNDKLENPNIDNKDIDPDEQAYFNAKKKVQIIHKAKKVEKKK